MVTHVHAVAEGGGGARGVGFRRDSGLPARDKPGSWCFRCFHRNQCSSDAEKGRMERSNFFSSSVSLSVPLCSEFLFAQKKYAYLIR